MTKHLLINTDHHHLVTIRITALVKVSGTRSCKERREKKKDIVEAWRLGRFGLDTHQMVTIITNEATDLYQSVVPNKVQLMRDRYALTCA